MLRNIVILNDYSYINGGAGNVAITSAESLAKLGYNVVLFAAVGPVNEISKLNIITLNQSDLLSNNNRLKAIIHGVYNSKAKNELLKLLSIFIPDETIIHLHGWYKALSPSIWSSIRKKKFKIVVTLHDYFLICPNGGLYNYPSNKICDKHPLSYKCFVSNCDSRSYAIKLWRNIRQIYQLVQIYRMPQVNFNIIYISKLNKEVTYPLLRKYTREWYYLANPIKLEFNKLINVSSNSKYLFMGRLSSEKGLDLFCQAITELGYEGIVVGDGPIKREYEERYQNIEFTGWLTGDKKWDYIGKCKCFVFPSRWYEGAPLTILEMLSVGLPCVVPNKCAAAEEIIDGKTGFVFESGHIDSLRKVLTRVENCDLSKMQHNIIANFDKDKYSLSSHCRNLLKIYNDILSH